MHEFVNTSIPVGEDNPTLESSDVTILEAVMDVIRDMYAGSCQVIQRLTGCSEYPSFQEDFLSELSKAPEWVDLVKSSSCRKGATRALALCKSYYPYVDLDQLVRGFPELKADGSAFQKADYEQSVKNVRHYATKIADDVSLQKFEPGYDENNKRRLFPEPKVKEPMLGASRKRPSPLSEPMRTTPGDVVKGLGVESAVQDVPQG